MIKLVYYKLITFLFKVPINDEDLNKIQIEDDIEKNKDIKPNQQIKGEKKQIQLQPMSMILENTNENIEEQNKFTNSKEEPDELADYDIIDIVDVVQDV